jgi:hypothetical protein
MEIALLHEDGTWETETHSIDLVGDECESVRAWWEKASNESQYRKVVLAVLFNDQPQEPL